MGVGSGQGVQLRVLRAIVARWLQRSFTIREVGASRWRYNALAAASAFCGTIDGSHRWSQRFSRQSLPEKIFSKPTQWHDKWRSKEVPTPNLLVLRHTRSTEALWLRRCYISAGAEPQPAVWDVRVGAGTKTPPRAFAAEGGLEIERCTQLCEAGRLSEAVESLSILVQQGHFIPNNLFYRALKNCIAQRNLLLGRRIHALSVQSGYEGNAFLATHLIGLYALHGKLQEAMRVFSKVSAPDAFNWASIIMAHAKHGEPSQAIDLYWRMRELIAKADNRIVFMAVLKACGTARDLVTGKLVHAHILGSADSGDMFVRNCLVDMYAKCGSLEDARRVFDRLPQKDVVTWNSMITGYAQQGKYLEAQALYANMLREGIVAPNAVTFVCLLQAFAVGKVASMHHVKQLHAEIEERGLQDNVVVGNNLVNLYARCGSLENARRVFDRLRHRDVVTWTAMIAGYSREGVGLEALSLYRRMQHEGITPPNAVTFVCLLQACASVGVAALEQGKQLHAQIEERGLLHDDVTIGNGLINMYAKCGSLEHAQRVFDKISVKNVATWTAMIAGYALQGSGQGALDLYRLMQHEEVSPPDAVTFVCLLQACAGVGAGALDQGKQLHAELEERGLQTDVVVGGSLVNMYAQCGSLSNAQRVFDSLIQKNVVTWNALLAAYVQQGMGQKSLSLYRLMEKEGTVSPDSVTYVCLLQACAAVAALRSGKALHAQIQARGLQRDVVVASSLVNMYAKCGCMEESQCVFDSMPRKEISAWGALFAGYSSQGDSDAVFNLLDRMRLESVEPDGSTFLSVLTVCSHVGLVDKGRKYFQIMSSDYGITPTVEHYTCMMDLLGRAGHLDEALQMGKAMPFEPDGAVWQTLLGSCRKWGNVKVARQAFELAVSLDDKNAAAYILMMNIYTSAQMWEEARQIQARRAKSRACKQPARSWCSDMGGKVHAFLVGSQEVS